MPKYWRAKNLAVLSENYDTKILANLNLAVWLAARSWSA